MGRNLFRRLFFVEDEDDTALFTEASSEEPDIETPATETKQVLATLNIAYFGDHMATVDIGETVEPVESVVSYQLRLVLDYYAEVLHRLRTSEAAEQLLQYIAALCMHLMEKDEVKRINILGSIMELLFQIPENSEVTHRQRASLLRNTDKSVEIMLDDPVLPIDYYLPTSMLLLLQNMLYTLSDKDVAIMLMSISAMHTFYATRYNLNEPESLKLASRHALQQVEQESVK